MSLDIVNRSLTLFGVDNVTSVTETPWSTLINDNVQRMYELMLEKSDWNFATIYTDLTLDTVNDNPKYTNSYSLPADYVRIIKVYNSEDATRDLYKYRIIGSHLYSNYSSINISYVSSSIDVDDTKESFKWGLSYAICALLAPILLQDKQLTKYFEDMSKTKLYEAISLDEEDFGERDDLYRKITRI